MDQTLNILKIIEGTSVDGTGLRTSIYMAGCNHHCLGCHNPHSWNIENGRPYTIDELMEVICYNEFPVTFSGGDPLFQVDTATELAKTIKQQTGLNIWCYTGHIWENIMRHSIYAGMMKYIDVLVDGPFVLAQRDTTLLFRGSTNQRIIDVKASVMAGEAVVIPDDKLLGSNSIAV